MCARPVKGESASSQAKGVAPKCQGRIVSLHISHYDDQSCVSHMSTRDTMRSVCPPTSPSSPALHITITPTWLFTAVTAPPHETLYERKMGVWRALGSFAPGLHFPGHATASDADCSPAAMRFGFFSLLGFGAVLPLGTCRSVYTALSTAAAPRRKDS